MTLPLGRVRRRVKNLLQPPPPPAYSYKTSKWYPNWSELLYRDRRLWSRALKRARTGPQVLIATSFGGHAPSAVLESTLAVALTLRGANVSLLLCDHALAACQQSLVTEFSDVEQFLENGPAKLCKWCFAPAHEVYRSLGLPVLKYSDYLDESQQQHALEIARTLPREEIPAFRRNNVAIGEHATAGALRFYARGELEQGPVPEEVLRRYLQAALQTAFAMDRMFDAHNFVSACFNHGIYVPQGLIGDVARNKNVRVVNWLPGYRKRRFIFTHHETYHHALMTEPVTNWETMPWSAAQEQMTLEYLKSRWYGTRDWIWFHEKPEHELQQIVAELGIDFGKPTIGMLTNVMWDAQLHYRANAFPNMLAWVLETIRYFAARPEIQLLMRIHPAEIRGTVPSRQPLMAEIRNAFPQLPSNVYIIPPESNISTYVAMQECDSVIIYGTKTGVELTSQGIPVIVAGEAWIRNKDLTLDASSPQEYLELLDRLPLGWRLDDARRTRALKYAFHFFFRRMIPLSMFEPQSGFPFYRVNLTRLEQLAPGADRGLDLVCEGILHGGEFVYPAEQYPEPAEDSQN